MYGASELMLKGRRPSNKSAYVGYGSGRADCLSTFVHRDPVAIVTDAVRR